MEFLQQSLDIAIGDPTAFLSNDREIKDSFLNGSKFLYDAANVAANVSLGRTFGPFDVLLTDGMDSETVWEQLSSRNKPVTRFLKKGIQKLRTKEMARVKKEEEEDEEDNDDAMDEDDEDEVYNDRKVARNAPTPFISAKKFDGVKPGYFFSKGSLGLGYYLDPSSNVDLTSEEDDDDFEEDGDDDEDGDVEEDGDDVDEEEFDDDEDGGIDDLDSEGGSFDSNGHDDYDELEEGRAGGRAKIEEEDDDEDDGGSGEDYEDGEGEDDDDDMSGDDDFSVDSQMDLGLYDDDDELINVSDRKKQKLEEYRLKDEARKNKNKNKSAAVVDDANGDDEEDELDDDDNEDGDEDSGDDDDDDDDGSSADDNEDEEDEEEEGDNTSTPVEPTSFAKRQAILQAQIKEYEANLVKDKSWELKGEVNSKDRPENSLLSVITDVERASKPVPIITQEYTTSIEDMIKKRIVDGKFNDVVKKLQSVDIIGSISRSGDDLQDVSQEKSKLGLGDIYAEQFMKDSASTKKEASAKKQAKDAEVKQLFDKACRELDALCHFFYSPRPVVADLSVKSLPVSSIAMEDPTPSFNSSHNSLAPQEVFDDKNGKRGFVKSEEEMTRDDRKRRRRHKKEINRKNASSDASSSSNHNRKDDEIKDKRVVKASGKSDSVTNPVKKFSKSHQFFENLETLKMK